MGSTAPLVPSPQGCRGLSSITVHTGNWELCPALPWRKCSPEGDFLLSVTPLEVQTSTEAVKGNEKEHRRNLRGQFCKGGQRSKESNTTTVIWWEGTKIQDEPQENMERREQGIHREEEGQGRNKEIEAPANCLDEVLPLPRHWTHCLQPSPFLLLSCASLSTDSACFKSEGDWCGSCTMGRSAPGARSTSLFYLCRLQGLHCKHLPDWSASRPHLTQLSWKMFLFRHWCDFIETSPFKMQAHTWRWKVDSHRYPWLGTASSPSLHILTTGPIRDAGCCKNRNLVLQGNLLTFLSDSNRRYSEANSIFVSAEIQAWRCQKWWQELSISMRRQPTCSTLSASHTQTISSYCKHQSETVQQNWI